MEMEFSEFMCIALVSLAFGLMLELTLAVDSKNDLIVQNASWWKSQCN